MLSVYAVNSLADLVAPDGLITLREALEAANTNAAVYDAPAGSATEADMIIIFAQDPPDSRITLEGSQLEILDDVEIYGPGPEGLTIDADGRSRVFYVGENVEAALWGLTITGGVGSGGGIYNYKATLDITRAVISHNVASGSGWGGEGGGIYNSAGNVTISDAVVSHNVVLGQSYSKGGGIYNSYGVLNITNSTVSHNTVNYSGGGVYDLRGTVTVVNSTICDNTASSGGGAIFDHSGTVTIVNSIVSGNRVTDSSWGVGGGIYNYSGTLDIVDSSIEDNSTGYRGGGIYSSGRLTVTNSTLSGNVAYGSYGRGGGIAASRGATITNSTIVHNSAINYVGGGVYSSYSPVEVFNSIVALNEALADPDLSGSLSTESDFNLIGRWTHDTLPGDNTIWGTAEAPLDPMLMAVADQDGVVVYYRPLPSSPAIDAGSNALAVDTEGNPLATDITGKPRIIGEVVDIGAVEHSNAPELIIDLSPNVELIEGQSTAVSVSLASAPVTEMVVNVERCAGGSEDITSDDATLTFDGTNWDVPQTVVFSAADDPDRVDDFAVFAFSGDAVATVCLAVSVLDDDFQTYLVDSLADTVAADGMLTLREALEAANTNTAVGDAPAGTSCGLPDVIAFAPELASGTIVLSGSQLTISDNVVIEGLGAESLSISAARQSRVLRIDERVEAKLDGLLITGGIGELESDHHIGGGILNYGTLQLLDCVVTGNWGTYRGGGIYNGGGDYEHLGTLCVTNSLIVDNGASAKGGGIYNAGTLTVAGSIISGNWADDGGGLFSKHIANIVDSTVSGNYGSGLFNTGVLIDDGMAYYSSTLNVTGSTILGNSPGNTYDSGGGIHSWNGTLTVTDSIIMANVAARFFGGGGIFCDEGTLTVVNSTISGNWADDGGGGISIDSSSATVQNSIVALNNAATGSDVYGTLEPESSHNLIGVDPHFVRNPSPGDDGVWGTEDDDFGDLHLRSDSPAINAGSNELAVDVEGEPLTVDLDGKARIIYEVVDIGAYEYNGSILVSTVADETNGDYTFGDLSLREALLLAAGHPGEDVITFDSSLFGQSIILGQGQLVVDSDVDVQGPGAELLTIDANQQSRVFYVGAGVEASIAGLTITGGYTADYGGGICNFGTLDVTNSTISDNSAAGMLGDGGGICSFGGTVNITSSTISENSAHDGGGIYSRDGILTVANSTLLGNSASSGGGIYGYEGCTTVTGSTLSGNWATATESYCGGGAICGHHATTIVTGSTISGNSCWSEGDGGGIHNSGVLTVTDSTFSDNSARNGGGICNYGPYAFADIAHSTLSGNSATGTGSSGAGGGIFGYRATMTVTASTLLANSAYAGGAIACDASSNLSVMDSTLSGNSAYGAAGVYGRSSILSITNSTISGNSATGVGGGIYVMSSTLSIRNATVTANSAPGLGGGLWGSYPPSRLLLHNTVIAGNTGADNSQVSGTVLSTSSYNLIGFCAGLSGITNGVNGNQIGVESPLDPMLGLLEGNGGPTLTHVPLPGSPLIDAGNDAVAVDPSGFPLVADQRGFLRRFGAVDIGAVEDQPPGVPVAHDDGAVGDQGQSITLDVLANDFCGNGAPMEVEIVEEPSHGALVENPDGTLTYTPEASFWGVDTFCYRALSGELASNTVEVTLSVLSPTSILVTTADDEMDGDLSPEDISLREALSMASPGSVIQFSADLLDQVIAFTHSASTLQVSNVEIVGLGPSHLAIHGLGRSTVITAVGDQSLVSHLTVTGGADSGIAVGQGASMLLDHVTVAGNTATSSGGGITNYGMLNVTDCMIFGNVAGRGGGIYSPASPTHLTVANSTISGNAATGTENLGYGGGIYGSGTITDSIISDNSAKLGGGVYGGGTMTNTIISGNAAMHPYDGRGGGIYSNVTLELTGSAISGNSATTRGGGIFVGTRSTVTIAHSTFSENVVTYIESSGGGIANDMGTVTILDSVVSGNTSAGSGGGISNSSWSTISVAGSTISDNSADRYGGGIYNYKGGLTFTSSTISGNAAGHGGGIYNYKGGLTFTSSTISGNAAGHGGGVYNDDGSLSITDSMLSHNSATGDGGGILGHQGPLTIANLILSGNSAGDAGGGVYADDSAVSITNSTIVGNSAEDNGGGILANESELNVTNSTVAANMASGSGGGIHSTAGTLILANTILALNEAAASANLYGIMARGSGGVLLGMDPGLVRNPSPGDDGTWGTGDDDYGDLHLRSDSLAINAGSNDLAVDAEGHPLETDLDGKQRIIYGTVDIGAYEYCLMADADYNGVVDDGDAGILAAHWGMSGMGWGEGDFSGDGRVDAVDACILAANRGATFEPPGEASEGNDSVGQAVPDTDAPADPVVRQSLTYEIGPVQATAGKMARRLIEPVAREDALFGELTVTPGSIALLDEPAVARGKNALADEQPVAPGSSEGDSPIFASQKSGQSPASQKSGQSPAAHDVVLAEKWGFALEQSRAARRARETGRDVLDRPVVDQLLATLR